MAVLNVCGYFLKFAHVLNGAIDTTNLNLNLRFVSERLLARVALPPPFFAQPAMTRGESTTRARDCSRIRRVLIRSKWSQDNECSYQKQVLVFAMPAS